MAREFAKAFYASKAWRKCRAAYIAQRKSIDGGMCESCREKPGYIVHHKTELQPWNINDPDVALNFDNLKYDCHICHNKENKGDETEGLVEYTFNELGEAIAISPPLNHRWISDFTDRASTYKKRTRRAREGV